VTKLRWVCDLAAAAIAAYAAHLAVQYATPIDRALPLIAVVVTLVAALSYRWLMIGVPLLAIAEMTIPDEGLRLLAFGVVVGGVFATALLSATYPRPPMAGYKPALLGLAAIVLLRWIPLSDVRVGRELFLLAIAALIVMVLDGTPFATALAVLVVLITPAVPLRTLILPVAVLLVAIVARMANVYRLKATWPSAIAVAFVLLFFPWSGIVARALPYFLHRMQPDQPRFAVMQALAANKTLTTEVPADARSLIVSGANVAKMERGTILGTIEPGGRKVRIGDAADWGFLRRETFYGTRNPLPRDPAGKIRGYGYAAWVDGAGRVPLPRGAATIRVTGDAALPPGASLQVEGFE
jgi:hypothetical protein